MLVDYGEEDLDVPKGKPRPKILRQVFRMRKYELTKEKWFQVGCRQGAEVYVTAQAVACLPTRYLVELQACSTCECCLPSTLSIVKGDPCEISQLVYYRIRCGKAHVVCRTERPDTIAMAFGECSSSWCL